MLRYGRLTSDWTSYVAAIAKPTAAIAAQIPNAVSTASVPEPTTLGLLSIGTIALPGRRSLATRRSSLFA